MCSYSEPRAHRAQEETESPFFTEEKEVKGGSMLQSLIVNIVSPAGLLRENRVWAPPTDPHIPNLGTSSPILTLYKVLFVK